MQKIANNDLELTKLSRLWFWCFCLICLSLSHVSEADMVMTTIATLKNQEHKTSYDFYTLSQHADM